MGISAYVDPEDIDEGYDDEPEPEEIEDEDEGSVSPLDEMDEPVKPKKAKPAKSSKPSTAKPRKPSKPKFQYVPNNFYTVDPKLISLEGEGKADTLYDARIEEDEGIKELAKGMEDEGFTSVVLAVEREDIGSKEPGSTYLQIVGGRRRIKAAIQAKLKEIPVLVLANDLPDYQYILSMLRENELRREDTPVNKARKIQSLVESYCNEHRPPDMRTPEEQAAVEMELPEWTPPASLRKEAIDLAANGMGISKKRVQQLLDLLGMAPQVVRAVERGKIAEHTVREWQPLEHDKQVAKLEKTLDAARARTGSDDGKVKPGKDSGKGKSGPEVLSKTFSKEMMIDIVTQDGVPQEIRDVVFYFTRELTEEEAIKKIKWLKKALIAMDTPKEEEDE